MHSAQLCKSIGNTTHTTAFYLFIIVARWQKRQKESEPRQIHTQTHTASAATAKCGPRRLQKYVFIFFCVFFFSSNSHSNSTILFLITPIWIIDSLSLDCEYADICRSHCTNACAPYTQTTGQLPIDSEWCLILERNSLTVTCIFSVHVSVCVQFTSSFECEKFMQMSWSILNYYQLFDTHK